MSPVPQNFDDFVQQVSRATASRMVQLHKQNPSESAHANFRHAFFQTVGENEDLRQFFNQAIQTLAENQMPRAKGDRVLDANLQAEINANDKPAMAKAEAAFWANFDNANATINPFNAADVDDNKKLESGNENALEQKITDRLLNQYKNKLAMAPSLKPEAKPDVQYVPKIRPATP